MPSRPELPPIEAATPRISVPPSVSGGLPAIFSATKHALTEMGPFRAHEGIAEGQPARRFRLPGLRLAGPRRPARNGGILRERRQGRRRGGDHQAGDAGLLRPPLRRGTGQWSDHEMGKAGRLTHPMLLREGAAHYEPVSWDEAFGILAEELRALPSPDGAVFYTSGRTSNEAAFAYQLFVRMFGTNNLPDCSNMCHESSGLALREVLGAGKGSVTLEDFGHADCILLIGQNPGTNHPRMLTTLQAAAKRGAQIISLNPLLETGIKAFTHPQKFWTWMGSGTPIATFHLPVRGERRHRGLERAHEGDARGRGTRPWHRLRSRLHRRPHPRLRGLRRGPPDHVLGGDHGRLRPGPGAAPGRRQAPDGLQGHHRLLGHGDHPADLRRGLHPGGGEPAAAAGPAGAPGGRRLPRARPQQRPGRPDHGHLRKARHGLPGCAPARPSGSTRRARTATTRCRRSAPCTKAGWGCSSPWAATSSPPRRTRSTPPRPCAAPA